MNKSDITILIVDDEPLNLEIIEEYLEGEGYRLVQANDGAEAWARLKAEPEYFDVVLLDRMMPNLDGMEVLKLVKLHPVLKSLPVILQTALASRKDIADGMRAGAYYYLTKPFGEEMLQSVVGTAVADRVHYREMQQQVELSSRMMKLMCEGLFKIQTVEQARELATMLANACPDPQRVVVGMSELLINGIEHGNLGITYEEKGQLKDKGTWQDEVEKRQADPGNAHKFVHIKLIREEKQVRFIITDEGDGFEFEQYLEMDPNRAFDPHGRGIAMARMMSFDFLEYQGNGNQVVVAVNL